jgi:hypothetical protein
MLVLTVALVFSVSGVWAADVEPLHRSSDAVYGPAARRAETRGARLETLWIFDADYEDLIGDNAGWTVYDRSGTLGMDNYWHHDTIRINGFIYLGTAPGGAERTTLAGGRRGATAMTGCRSSSGTSLRPSVSREP